MNVLYKKLHLLQTQMNTVEKHSEHYCTPTTVNLQCVLNVQTQVNGTCTKKCKYNTYKEMLFFYNLKTMT